MDRCILPLELCDLIIHQMADTTSLSASALVCRGWLPSARACRFRTLVLDRPGAAKRYWANVKRIRSFVRRLDIRCERSSWITWQDEQAYLLPLLAQLRNVEHVELTGVDLVWQPDPVRVALVALLWAPTTKSVVFRNGTVLPADFSALLGSATKSVELLDVSIDVGDDNGVVFGLPETRAQLQSLRIAGNDLDYVVDGLAGHLRDIHTLSIRCSPDDLFMVEPLLLEAQTLQCLEVELSTDSITVIAAARYECVQRVLTVHLSTAPAADQDRVACFRAFERLGKQLPSAGVTNLRVNIGAKWPGINVFIARMISALAPEDVELFVAGKVLPASVLMPKSKMAAQKLAVKTAQTLAVAA
ncbi:hypothetical protein HMN09_00443300 [Mycena chlorophos]|uniref:F-box domain-containing protein n=1 Tax=Mycena chlorophos TaxID=658473 RepID=A0A8H6WHJ9_MYCCL|nr:hypothetical protein HMN09_00443300 [Mycena chlorophos]